MAGGVNLDLGGLGGRVAKRAQRLGHGAVDDLEVAAAGELLELHQREVRLDARRVAIHHEADRAGRRDDGRLGVAIAVGLAKFERAIPRALGGFHQRLVLERGVVEGDRRHRQFLVALRLAMGGAAVVANDAQHVLGVGLVFGEGSKLLGHLGRGRVADAGHDRGERADNGATLVAVIGDARGHQQAADIGVAEAERAVIVGEAGDFLRGELRHHHRDFEHHGPDAHRVLI